MDDIDRAQAHEQALRDDALAAHHRRVHGESDEPPAPSAHWCIDCDAPIPEARRLAVPGCTRCVECQALAEEWE